MEMKIGVCPWCGQANMEKEFDTQEEADRYAAENCSCTEAVHERNILRKAADARAIVWQFFGEDCDESEFGSELASEIIEALYLLTDRIVRGYIDRASLKIGTTTADISGKGGKISVQRRDINASKVET